MLYNVSGINFDNHGAVMMLQSTINKLVERDPKAKVSVRAAADYHERSKFHLYQRVDLERERGNIAPIVDLVPKRVKRALGVVSRNDVDVWLDASGFAFGDFWGAAKIRNRLYPALDEKKKRGAPVILLPQALGPFSGPGMREAFSRVVDEADLICVRDASSFAYLNATFKLRENIIRCPDFTIDLAPVIKDGYAHLGGRPCVVPNSMIARSLGDEALTLYFGMLVAAVGALRKVGQNPFILLHDPVQDGPLARDLCDKVGGMDCISEPDPLAVKGILKGVSMVVGSRFHALVSSLSQGVPSIVIGWSHKYQELLADYRSPESLIAISPNGERAVTDLINCYADPATAGAKRAELMTFAEIQRGDVSAMWQRVYRVIDPVRKGKR